MRDVILKKLDEIEKEHQVKILYACESGSRAWGFASPDSDFDVRFIYIHTQNHYLSIDDGDDVIELPVNEVLDISGWDIRKALKLFRKSNPPLMEWLQSPIIYKANHEFYTEIKNLAPQYFIPRSGYNHYLNMAINAFEGSLLADRVKLKKYFYALRPILACRWTIDKGTLPPMEFEHLRALVTDSSMQTAFDKLLEKKAVTDEKQLVPRNTVIHQFLEDNIAYCKQHEQSTLVRKNESEVLNTLFRKYLNASW